MKKRLLAFLTAVILALSACGASTEVNRIRDGKKLSDVTETVSAAFSEAYDAPIVPEAKEIDRQALCDLCGADTAAVKRVSGWVSSSLKRSDAFLAVQAADGHASELSEALAGHVRALLAQYENYPVGNSYARAKAARIYVKGNYVFLIAVGSSEEDPSDYEEQVQFVMDQIDALFT